MNYYKNPLSVEIPCKPGDIVYLICGKAVLECKVIELLISEIGITAKAIDKSFYTVIEFTSHNIGNIIFFSEEKARKALEKQYNV